MATFAIGDIQGCWIALQRLLDKINFDPEEDTLWFTGDLVNRGPSSLETVRFVKKLGDAAITVLGNHELHLLAIAHGKFKARKGDTFDALLTAHDRDELIEWIRQRPLMHRDKSLGYTMVHAGLPPQWGIKEAAGYAKEVESILKSEQIGNFLANMYGDEPSIWSENLKGFERLRFITNCLTRIRYCDKEGRLNLKQKGTPGSQPDGLFPWFELPNRKSHSEDIVFGHWSTLGFRAESGIFSLDTGCLWGGQLTALRLDGEEMFRTSINCSSIKTPEEDSPQKQTL